MPQMTVRSVITGIKCGQAMRRHVVRCSPEAPIDRSIAAMIKHKSNALLIDSPDLAPFHRGVVSKTDLCAVYCASLPLSTPVGEVRNAPVQSCLETDKLETALELMAERDIRRVYVSREDTDRLTGVLSHFDVAGLIYRICRKCRQDKSRGLESNGPVPWKVKDVMSPSVLAYRRDRPLSEVVEGLIAHHVGAVLITDSAGRPSGVLSKTNVILAYRHGLEPDSAAGEAMTSSVISIPQEELLSEALRRMIAADIQRVFVEAQNSDSIVGVLSLTDASRTKSGTCKACKAARVEL